MWIAEKIYYRGNDNYVRAYQGREIVWDKNSNSMIFYTSTDNTVVRPYNSSSFGGRSIVSNTNVNGQGVMVFDGTLTVIGYNAFMERHKLATVVIPETITEIGQGAFWECISLRSINLPEGLLIIRADAFNDNEMMETITIPSTVTYIGAAAFADCLALSEVIVNAVTPPTMDVSADQGYHQFDHNASGRLIKVPSGSVQAYKTAAGWSKYASSIVSQ